MTGSIRRVARRRVVSDPTGERPGGPAAGDVGAVGAVGGVGSEGEGSVREGGVGTASGLEQTSDDTDDGWGEAPAAGRSYRDEWLRAQRPPHWE